MRANSIEALISIPYFSLLVVLQYMIDLWKMKALDVCEHKQETVFIAVNSLCIVAQKDAGKEVQ